MFLRGLRLANQATEDTSKGNCLLHGTSRRGGSQGLQMEWQVVLDGGARLDGLDLEGSADVGQHRGAKG